MNEIKELIDQHNFRIKKYKQYKNTRIIDTDKGKFLVKKKKGSDNDELFKYLESRNYSNHLSPYSSNNDYDIYPFINNINTDCAEKALDIVYLTAMLHNKTTYYKRMSVDEIKEIYEALMNDINYINNYYENLRMIIEEITYPSPSNYLLLRNCSIVFKAIEDSKYFINKWYEKAEVKKSFRVATLHNNLELDHLIKDTNPYLISWDNSIVNFPIYDIVKFYKSCYNKVDFLVLLDVYNSKYPLLEDEKYLLFGILLIPDKIELSKREIENTTIVYKLTNYLLSTSTLVSKYYSPSTKKETTQ